MHGARDESSFQLEETQPDSQSLAATGPETGESQVSSGAGSANAGARRWRASAHASLSSNDSNHLDAGIQSSRGGSFRRRGATDGARRGSAADGPRVAAARNATAGAPDADEPVPHTPSDGANTRQDAEAAGEGVAEEGEDDLDVSTQPLPSSGQGEEGDDGNTDAAITRDALDADTQPETPSAAGPSSAERDVMSASTRPPHSGPRGGRRASEAALADGGPSSSPQETQPTPKTQATEATQATQGVQSGPGGTREGASQMETLSPSRCTQDSAAGGPYFQGTAGSSRGGEEGPSPSLSTSATGTQITQPTQKLTQLEVEEEEVMVGFGGPHTPASLPTSVAHDDHELPLRGDHATEGIGWGHMPDAGDACAAAGQARARMRAAKKRQQQQQSAVAATAAAATTAAATAAYPAVPAATVAASHGLPSARANSAQSDSVFDLARSPGPSPQPMAGAEEHGVGVGKEEEEEEAEEEESDLVATQPAEADSVPAETLDEPEGAQEQTGGASTQEGVQDVRRARQPSASPPVSSEPAPRNREGVAVTPGPAPGTVGDGSGRGGASSGAGGEGGAQGRSTRARSARGSAVETPVETPPGERTLLHALDALDTPLQEGGNEIARTQDSAAEVMVARRSSRRSNASRSIVEDSDEGAAEGEQGGEPERARPDDAADGSQEASGNGRRSLAEAGETARAAPVAATRPGVSPWLQNKGASRAPTSIRRGAPQQRSSAHTREGARNAVPPADGGGSQGTVPASTAASNATAAAATADTATPTAVVAAAASSNTRSRPVGHRRGGSATDTAGDPVWDARAVLAGGESAGKVRRRRRPNGKGGGSSTDGLRSPLQRTPQARQRGGARGGAPVAQSSDGAGARRRSSRRRRPAQRLAGPDYEVGYSPVGEGGEGPTGDMGGKGENGWIDPRGVPSPHSASAARGSGGGSGSAHAPGSSAPSRGAPEPAQAPDTAATHPPDTAATHPPDTSATQPPDTSATQPPAATATQPPATAATHPPATSATHPPATAASQPPAAAATHPPATAASQPPAAAATHPPAAAATQPPATAASQPPDTSATHPPATAATQPPAAAATLPPAAPTPPRTRGAAPAGSQGASASGPAGGGKGGVPQVEDDYSSESDGVFEDWAAEEIVHLHFLWKHLRLPQNERRTGPPRTVLARYGGSVFTSRFGHDSPADDSDRSGGAPSKRPRGRRTQNGDSRDRSTSPAPAEKTRRPPQRGARPRGSLAETALGQQPTGRGRQGGGGGGQAQQARRLPTRSGGTRRRLGVRRQGRTSARTRSAATAPEQGAAEYDSDDGNDSDDFEEAKGKVEEEEEEAKEEEEEEAGEHSEPAQFFQGVYFLFTSLPRSKGSATVNRGLQMLGSGSAAPASGAEVTAHAVEAAVRQHGGDVVRSVEEAEEALEACDTCARDAGNGGSESLVVIARPTAQRTWKALFSVARGVPCLHPLWVLDSHARNELVAPDRYRLPAGTDALARTVVPPPSPSSPPGPRSVERGAAKKQTKQKKQRQRQEGARGRFPAATPCLSRCLPHGARVFAGLRFALVGGNAGTRAEWALILLAAGAACAEDGDAFDAAGGAEARPRAKARRKPRRGRRAARRGKGDGEGPDFVLSLEASAQKGAEVVAPVLEAWSGAIGVTLEWASHCLVTQSCVEPSKHPAFAAGPLRGGESPAPGRSTRKRSRTQHPRADGIGAAAGAAASEGDHAAITVAGEDSRRFRLGSVVLYKNHGRHSVGKMETVRGGRVCIRRLRVGQPGKGAAARDKATWTLTAPTNRVAYDVVTPSSVLSRLLCLPEAIAEDTAAGYLGRDPEVCVLDASAESDS